MLNTLCWTFIVVMLFFSWLRQHLLVFVDQWISRRLCWKRDHGILALHANMCDVVTSADFFAVGSSGRRRCRALLLQTIARLRRLAFGPWLLLFPFYWASIALSWRGFRTRIIYFYFQTNINKRLNAWTECREICKSTQPRERPGWEQSGNQKWSGYRPTSTALRAEANVWHSCVT